MSTVGIVATRKRARSVLAFIAFSFIVPVVACSDDDSDPALASPGDTCDGSRLVVCGSLAKGGSRRDVILVCKGGVYETALNCAPGGNGQTNRCFGGGGNTLADCFDEPDQGQVTRCQASGSGSSVTSSCTVGQR